MKRALLILLILLLATPAHASTYRPRFNRLANVKACPQHWHRSIAANRRLVACEARLFGVSASVADCVVSHESGFHWWEAWSGNYGTYQLRFWRSRFVSYGARAGGFKPRWRNSRSNVFVAMKLQADKGWGQWSAYGNHCS